MRIAGIVVCSLATAILLTTPMFAHVLITDTTKKNGAILHIQPDDNPVAGEPSHIFYDIQNLDTTRSDLITALTITHENSGTTDVPILVNENGISADYIFPDDGVYTLMLVIKSSTDNYMFESSQRVSRGDAAAVTSTVLHTWAEILLIASCVGLLTLLIVGVNYNKRIKAYSTF